MHGPIELVETPLQRTRYFLVFGTELTLNETFPYCKRCRGSARRVRLGALSKMLAGCVVIAALFLVLVLSANSLPTAVSANLFRSAVIGGILLTLVYFYLREWRSRDRTYYQPVSLVDAAMGGDELGKLTIRFYNKKYAKIFKKANSELISSGMLRVQVAGDNAM